MIYHREKPTIDPWAFNISCKKSFQNLTIYLIKSKTSTLKKPSKTTQYLNLFLINYIIPFFLLIFNSKHLKNNIKSFFFSLSLRIRLLYGIFAIEIKNKMSCKKNKYIYLSGVIHSVLFYFEVTVKIDRVKWAKKWRIYWIKKKTKTLKGSSQITIITRRREKNLHLY